MSVAVLSPDVVSHPIVSRRSNHSSTSESSTSARRSVATPRRVKASNLERAEDQLLAQSLRSHPNRDTAIDAALDDMETLSAEIRDCRRRPLLLRSATQLNQVEDLLLEAVIRTHPNRDRALARLMDDLCCEEPSLIPSAIDCPIDGPIDHDNDFDGLG